MVSLAKCLSLILVRMILTEHVLTNVFFFYTFQVIFDTYFHDNQSSSFDFQKSLL